MKIVPLTDALVADIKKGSLFIYPTDTVYGLGCNALKGKQVEKLRALKATTHPFSVIAPSMAWIAEHVETKHTEFLQRLPGSYTFIMRKKDPSFLRECSATGVLGVRIPDHKFSRLIARAGVPFVTTSCNPSGQKTCISLEDVPKTLQQVDIAVDAGVLRSPPSEIWDLTGAEPRRIR